MFTNRNQTFTNRKLQDQIMSQDEMMLFEDKKPFDSQEILGL